MLDKDGDELVDRYVRFVSGDDDSGFQELLAEDFYDHVSRQRGSAIWAQVVAWGKATFADRVTEHWAVRDDYAMVEAAAEQDRCGRHRRSSAQKRRDSSPHRQLRASHSAT